MLPPGMLRGLCASCEKYRNPTWRGRHFFMCVLVTCIFSLKLSTSFAYILPGLWWLSCWLLWVISTFDLLSAHPALFQPHKAAVSGPEADAWQDFRSVDSPHSSRPTKSHTPFSPVTGGVHLQPEVFTQFWGADVHGALPGGDPGAGPSRT